MSEIHWSLKNCNLFERLTPNQLKQLEMTSRFRRFPRNTPVYLPAEESDGVFLLVSGRVKICSFTTEGKQSILTFIEPGELFGELAILEGGQREEYAETLEASEIVLIPSDKMQQLLEEIPHVALGITKLIGWRRKRIERRLKYLLFHSNRERLIHLLLELAEQYGKKTEQGVELTIKLSHQDIANVIGGTRETVTVLLGDLKSEELVALGRRKITLLQPERLAESVEAPPPVLRNS